MAIINWFKNRAEKGNIAIIVVVSLTVLIGMLALVVDGGHLYASKNKWQNGVEAAALAGALHLCDDDYEAISRQIALENGLPATVEEGLTISRGFYDENDLYDDFTIYKEFVAENGDDFPEGEYCNAMMVFLEADVSTFLAGLFGMEQVQIKASAVAYLKSIGMAALNDDSVIRIGPQTTLQNGDVYSNGDIKFPDADYVRSGWLPKTYTKPEFINTNLYAQGQVLECPAYAGSIGLRIYWDSGTESAMDNAFSGSPRLTTIEPCDDDYIESLRATADVVYEISDAATDNVFWARNADSTVFAFDLTGERDSREVIFFDAEGNDVLISEGQYCLGCGGGGCVYYDGHPSEVPNGERIYNVTFITNGDIMMDKSTYQNTQIWGEEGDQQAVIITSGNIQVTGNEMEGIVYRCGGFFGTHPDSDNSGEDKARIIADGDIRLYCYRKSTDCSIEDTYTRRWIGTTDFKFGPPCPFARSVHLGKVEPSGG